MIKGIDISSWQGQVNFTALPSDIEFVIARSSYGTGYIDKQFARNIVELRKLPNKAHGFYHYAYPTYNKAEDEADWFLQTVGTLQQGEFLCLDFEERYTDPVSWCLAFLNRVSHVLGGYKPLIYINKYLMTSYDWSPIVALGYGLWLAYWDYNPDAPAPAGPWSVTAIRQYSNHETVTGIAGNVDGNVFYGDLTQLRKYGYTDIPTDEWKVKYDALLAEHQIALAHISNLIDAIKKIDEIAEDALK
jgi:GH25 family lysozyme M1 (1,4-beta-N-acetylmuramidase)